LEQHKREIKTSNNKLYKFLRQTGCWENWNFQIFDEQLVNKEEAYAYEQFLIYYLQPTLNKQGKKSLRKTMMTENYFLCSLIKSEIDPI
jgi:hypothetical protein